MLILETWRREIGNWARPVSTWNIGLGRTWEDALAGAGFRVLLKGFRSSAGLLTATICVSCASVVISYKLGVAFSSEFGDEFLDDVGLDVLEKT